MTPRDEEAIKIKVAANEICHRCRTREATMVGHGMLNGAWKDFPWCAKCYVRRNKQNSSKELNRLSGPEEEL